MAYPKINLKFSLDPAVLQGAAAPDGYKIYRGAASDPCPNGDCSGSTPITNGSISPSDTEIIYTDTTASDRVPYYYRSEYTRSSDGSSTSGVKIGPIVIEGQATLGHPGTLPGYGSKTPFECSVAPMFHFDANVIAKELDVESSTSLNSRGEKYKGLGNILPFNRSFLGTSDALKYRSLDYASASGIIKEYSLDKTKYLVSCYGEAYNLRATLKIDSTDADEAPSSYHPWVFDKGYTAVFLFSNNADGGTTGSKEFRMGIYSTTQHQVRAGGLAQSYGSSVLNPDNYTFQRVSDGKYIPNPMLEIQEIQIQDGTKQRSAEFPGLPDSDQLNGSSDSPIFPGQYCSPHTSRVTHAGGIATYGRPYHGSDSNNFTSNYMRTPTSKDRMPSAPSNGLHIAVFRMQSLEEAKAQKQFPLYQIWLDGSLLYSDRIYRSRQRTSGSTVNFGDLGYTNWDGLVGGANQSNDIYIPVGPSFSLFTTPYRYSTTESWLGYSLEGTCYSDALQFNQSLGSKDLGQIISYLQTKGGDFVAPSWGGYTGL